MRQKFKRAKKVSTQFVVASRAEKYADKYVWVVVFKQHHSHLNTWEFIYRIGGEVPKEAENNPGRYAVERAYLWIANQYSGPAFRRSFNKFRHVVEDKSQVTTDDSYILKDSGFYLPEIEESYVKRYYEE